MNAEERKLWEDRIIDGLLDYLANQPSTPIAPVIVLALIRCPDCHLLAKAV